MTLNWATQVSFVPKLIGNGGEKTAWTHELIEAGRCYSLCTVAREDRTIVRKFTRPVTADLEAGTLNGFPFHDGPSGAPILDQAVSWIDCALRQAVDCGGHTFFIGEVVDCGFRQEEDTPVLRMDSDTMEKPGSHEEAFRRFREGEVKILLGTQMIAKGLDFPNVTLVGVVNADTALHFPDFRAAERTFQLVTQVAGRTGRGERGGRVLVQTSSPEHPAILAAVRHDFALFAENELPIRQEFGYPPFASMVRLIVRGPSETATESFAESLGEQVRQRIEAEKLEVRVLGPAPAPIAYTSRMIGTIRLNSWLFR